MSYESAPSYRRQDPLVREAQFIAGELDHNLGDLALQRLQEDMWQLQGSPNSQRRLLSLVERFDHKGQGLDLQVRRIHRDGYDDVHIGLVNQSRYGYGADLQQRNQSRQTDYFRQTDYSQGRQANDYYQGRQTGDYYQGRQSGDYYQGRQSSDYYHGRQTEYYQPGQTSASNGYNDSSVYRSNQYAKSHNQTNFEIARPGSLTNSTQSALQWAQAEASRHGVNIQVTSAGRTHEDQARLYAQLHGKSPVALPGTSSHETGKAIDVANPKQAEPYLLAAGFTHGDGAGPIPGDPWHFKYVGTTA